MDGVVVSGGRGRLRPSLAKLSANSVPRCEDRRARAKINGELPPNAMSGPSLISTSGCRAAFRSQRAREQTLVSLTRRSCGDRGWDAGAVEPLWPFWSDLRRIVQQDLDIAEYTEPINKS